LVGLFLLSLIEQFMQRAQRGRKSEKCPWNTKH
jgi:hypothetical protein